MPLPSFNTPPQFLEVPAYPIVQPAFGGLPGPYSFGGKIFWIFCEDASSSAPVASLVAYSNTSSTGAQPSTRIASTLNIKGSNNYSTSYPGSGSLLYVTFYSFTSVSVHSLQVVTFDMSNSTWGTPNDTGVTLSNSDPTLHCYGFLLANGNIQLVYSTTPGETSLSAQVYTIIFSSGVWGSPTLISDGISNWDLLSCVAISTNKIGVFLYTYVSSINRTSIYYGFLSGTTLTTAVYGAYNSLGTNEGNYSYYDPVSDTAAMAGVQITTGHQVNLFLASPSASTTVSTVTVYNDSGNAFNYDFASVAGNSAGNTFYLITTDQIDSQIHIFGSSALASGWTASPAVYYNQGTNEPSPAPVSPEILPLYSTFVGGTTYAVTAGFLMDVSGTNWCGVMAALIPGNSASVTCSITIVDNLAANCNNPPVATQNIPYTHTLTATGGVAPYTFAIVSGSLPPGLTLDGSTGIISGTPNTPGVYPFSVQVTDSTPVSITINCSITVIGTQLQASCNNPMAATLGVFYTHTFTASGGLPPFTFAITGSVPPGLSFNTSNGILSGIPTMIGSFVFTVTVTDAGAFTANVTCLIVTQTIQNKFTELYSWRSFADPDLVFSWRTQAQTFGFHGYIHCGRIEMMYSSKDVVTIALTAFDGTNSQTMTIPSTGGTWQKVLLTPTYNKGQLLSFSATSPTAFQISGKDSLLWLMEWGSSKGYALYPLMGETRTKP